MQNDRKRLVEPGDLSLINAALIRGSDVRIKATRDGCKILEERVKVLRGDGKTREDPGTG